MKRDIDLTNHEARTIAVTRHRPPRLTQVFGAIEPLYFVTFNTHKRKGILSEIHIHEVFVGFCRSGIKHGAAVGRYVIMPDHLHCFVRLATSGVRLDAWVKSLRSVLGKCLIKNGVQRPHWQEGFFDHMLRSSESYREKWEYVRQNPVRAGLCEVPEAWPYQGEIVQLEC